MTLAMIEIERVMRREAQGPPGGENDFQIRNQSDILATFQTRRRRSRICLRALRRSVCSSAESAS